MIYQDVRKNAMQIYIKYQAYYDKKANSSKLKEADYVYVLQPEVDYQGSKTPCAGLLRIGPYNFQKLLPSNNYFVRKNGTNETQVLHRMWLHQFTARQPLPDIPITPQDWKPYPEVSTKHDDLCARAWECENERSIFDAENNTFTPSKSPEFAVRSDLSTRQTGNTPGTSRERSPDVFPKQNKYVT